MWESLVFPVDFFPTVARKDKSVYAGGLNDVLVRV